MKIAKSQNPILKKCFAKVVQKFWQPVWFFGLVSSRSSSQHMRTPQHQQQSHVRLPVCCIFCAKELPLQRPSTAPARIYRLQYICQINSNWGRFPKHNGSVCVYADLNCKFSWPFFCLSGLMHSQREAYWMPGMRQCLTKGGYHIFQMSTVTTVTTNQPQEPGGGRMKTSKRIRIR